MSELPVRLRRALVGARTRDRKVVSQLLDLELVKTPRERLDPFGRWWELELTMLGRVLTLGYREKGLPPEPEPKQRPVFDLRGLVVHRPWAACIATGRKRWENRRYSTAVKFAATSLVGRRIAIIEAQTVDRKAYQRLRLAPDGTSWPADIAPMHVVCVATLERVVGPEVAQEDPWRVDGECAYELGDVHLLAEAVRCEPGQGWMALERRQAEVAAAVREQERRRAA